MSKFKMEERIASGQYAFTHRFGGKLVKVLGPHIHYDDKTREVGYLCESFRNGESCIEWYSDDELFVTIGECMADFQVKQDNVRNEMRKLLEEHLSFHEEVMAEQAQGGAA